MPSAMSGGGSVEPARGDALAALALAGGGFR